MNNEILERNLEVLKLGIKIVEYSKNTDLEKFNNNSEYNSEKFKELAILLDEATKLLKKDTELLEKNNI